jgi:competence protein ComEC
MNARPRIPFAALVFGAVAGILSVELAHLSSLPLLNAAIAMGVITWMAPRKWICVVFTAIAFGFLHTKLHLENPALQIAKSFSGPQTLEIDGIVQDEPRVSAEGEASFLLRATVVSDPPLDAGFVQVRSVGEKPATGDRVRIRGLARPMMPPRNPGEFDEAAWSARQGVSFQLRCENEADALVIERGAGRHSTRLAAKARQWIRGQLARGIETSPEKLALIESMVLGVNAETPPEMRDLFQKTGTLHLLAVSGLNVAMLAGISLKILKPLRVKRAAAVMITIIVLTAYAMITGLSPSCTRAAIMAAFILAAPCFDRNSNALNSLAGAAFMLLAWDTNQLFSVGFQLSFGIVFVILVFARRIQERMSAWANPDSYLPVELWSKMQRFRVAMWHLFAVATGVNIASWLGSLVFMAGYFHLISPVAIVANFIAVGIAFCILALGLASVVSAAAATVSVLFNYANSLCASVLLWVVGVFAQVPYGYVYVEVPRIGETPVCELTVLDMGEGAATHLRSDGNDWLVDTGHLRNYSHTLLPYLRSRGINRLDALVLTHGDAAHLGAAGELLREFEPRMWIEGRPADRSPTRRALHEILAAHKIGRSLCAPGDTWKVGPDTQVRVLYPPPDLERSVADDQALVLLISSAEQSIILMSDAGFATSQWLIKNEPALRADVVVKGWHDKDAADVDFISHVAPQLVIAGAPDFGAPPERLEKWADHLRQKGITVFPQTRTGAVQLRIFADGRISANPQLPGAEPATFIRR